MPVPCVDAGAPQFGHAWAKSIQRGQVEQLVAVQPAGGLGLLSGEHPVGGDHRAAWDSRTSRWSQ